MNMNKGSLNYDISLMQYKNLLMKYYDSTDEEFLNPLRLQYIVTFFAKNIFPCLLEVNLSKEKMEKYLKEETEYINSNFLGLSRQIRVDYSVHSLSFLLFAIQKRLETLHEEKRELQVMAYQLQQTVFCIYQDQSENCYAHRPYGLYRRQSFIA